MIWRRPSQSSSLPEIQRVAPIGSRERTQSWLARKNTSSTSPVSSSTSTLNGARERAFGGPRCSVTLASMVTMVSGTASRIFGRERRSTVAWGRWNRTSTTRAPCGLSSSRSNSFAFFGPIPGNALAGANSGSSSEGRMHGLIAKSRARTLPRRHWNHVGLNTRSPRRAPPRNWLRLGDRFGDAFGAAMVCSIDADGSRNSPENGWLSPGQEDRARHRKGAKSKRAQARRIEARNDTKTKEQEHRPRHDDDDERPGNRARQLT